LIDQGLLLESLVWVFWEEEEEVDFGYKTEVLRKKKL
jgi:hypothetical protein